MNNYVYALFLKILKKNHLFKYILIIIYKILELKMKKNI